MSFDHGREYFLGLSLVEKFRFFRSTYGAQPLLALHITENERREQLVVVTAGLRNMVERSEWGQPDDVVLTRRFKQTYSLEGLLGEAMWRLSEVMKESIR